MIYWNSFRLLRIIKVEFIMKNIYALAIAMTLMTSSTVLASPLNYYNQLLANNSLTIRYENTTPLPRVTNRDKVSIYGKDGMNLSKVNFLTNRPFKGVVVVNGSDKYEEIGNDEVSICSLTLGDKVFFFTKALEKGKIIYYGNEGAGKVSASNRNLQAEYISGSSYADPNLSRLLSALLPAAKLPMDMPYYKNVRSGKLPNGLVYEDFYTEQEGTEEAIRYYLNGNSLVKIAAASLKHLPNGTVDGDKVIIRIKEFSNMPDTSLLTLPEGLKDVTKK